MVTVALGKRRSAISLSVGAIGLSFGLSFMVPGMAAPADAVRNFLPQKYSQYLGDAGRSACGYYIDPNDVYQVERDRFMTALVARGTTGTACRGVVEFAVLQADCQTKTLYLLELVGDEPSKRTWSRRELQLTTLKDNDFKQVGSIAAQQVCSLPSRTLPAR